MSQLLNLVWLAEPSAWIMHNAFEYSGILIATIPHQAELVTFYREQLFQRSFMAIIAECSWLAGCSDLRVNMIMTLELRYRRCYDHPAE